MVLSCFISIHYDHTAMCVRCNVLEGSLYLPVYDDRHANVHFIQISKNLNTTGGYASTNRTGDEWRCVQHFHLASILLCSFQNSFSLILGWGVKSETFWKQWRAHSSSLPDCVLSVKTYPSPSLCFPPLLPPYTLTYSEGTVPPHLQSKLRNLWW